MPLLQHYSGELLCRYIFDDVLIDIYYSIGLVVITGTQFTTKRAYDSNKIYIFLYAHGSAAFTMVVSWHLCSIYIHNCIQLWNIFGSVSYKNIIFVHKQRWLKLDSYGLFQACGNQKSYFEFYDISCVMASQPQNYLANPFTVRNLLTIPYHPRLSI